MIILRFNLIIILIIIPIIIIPIIIIIAPIITRPRTFNCHLENVKSQKGYTFNLVHMTTNEAKDDGNMQILNFHMFHIVLLPGVLKIYAGRRRSLVKYTLGAGGVL